MEKETNQENVSYREGEKPSLMTIIIFMKNFLQIQIKIKFIGKI